ncbi:MAG: 7-carboxy-7-deazaguanine synthase QueE [Bacteroidia bacterium]|nr:7-carboxy-7-deazaguanine synthase QueE [Bacteroidia bacterium]
MEHFYTIQGEGFNTGKPCYFVRLGGCDVGCFWCDVKESWDADAHPQYTVDQITAWAVQAKAPYVVITGGEPLMYNLDILTASLQEAGIQTFIETSGAHPLSGHWDWICFSPKKFKAPHESIYAAADELKIIVYNKSDLAWAEEHAALVNSGCRLYLQPEWSRSAEMLPLIIDYVKRHPRWTLSLQTHKFINIP